MVGYKVYGGYMKRISVVLICVLALLLCACDDGGETVSAPKLVNGISLPAEYRGSYIGGAYDNVRMDIDSYDVRIDGVSFAQVVNEMYAHSLEAADYRGVRYWASWSEQELDAGYGISIYENIDGYGYFTGMVFILNDDPVLGDDLLVSVFENMPENTPSTDMDKYMTIVGYSRI